MHLHSVEKLAELENAGKLRAVITQNIDGLHQRAGSREVLELHGSVLRNYCTRCGAFYDAEFVKSADGIPKCTQCGGTVKPDVVLYEEGLDNQLYPERGCADHRRDKPGRIPGGGADRLFPWE